ncbi:MAG: hypothetical protein KAX44_01190 [Candidatus Brocadiae bacterium]|nr:hypothetical protein [Candidatus Brocadiia bacterium]
MPGDSSFPPAVPVTSGPGHHFFGYYDKTPWDATGRYILALETGFADRPPEPDDVAAVGLIDTENDCAWQPLTQTTAWNWQQGAMLQWLPGASDRLIVYNCLHKGHFAGVIRHAFRDEERLLPRPVYALSPDGRTAFSTNFARIADTRPGYGYVGLADPWKDDPHPEDDGIYWMDIEKGEHRLIISLARIAACRPDGSMESAKHWFNHVQVNTDGSRFAFLHRWRKPEEPHWRTRLFTADPDGSDVHCVADHEMVSHYDWRRPDHILAWARQHDIGDGYFLFTDRSDGRKVLGKGTLTKDGHCSYSPDRRWILTDEAPDSEHKGTLLLYRPDDGERVDIGRFFSPLQLAGEIRCDLHPRWSRDGRQICFDSAHEGGRQVYVMDVGQIVAEA